MGRLARALGGTGHVLVIILLAIAATALWFLGFTLIVVGLLGIVAGEPPQWWWIPLGLVLFGAGIPAYLLWKRVSASG